MTGPSPENPPICRVLLIDDDEPFRTAMGKALRRRGFEATGVGDGRTAVALLGEPPAENPPHVAVLDLRMPDLDGLEVLRRTQSRRIPVIVLSGHGSVPDAVEAMRLGAFTFLMKPIDAEALAPVIRQAVQPANLPDGLIVGDSPATAAFRAVLDRLAQADEPILLTGETGTGKEVAARYLHRRSRRALSPFVAVNMACLPRDLVESELFGHARGAFTGADRRKPGLLEETGEGTLFLDEIAELPIEHQPKLLRVLESRTYRPVGETRERPFAGRLVAATHRELTDEVRAGRFRQDLYFRLHVLPLELPPLRGRPEDILPILRHWLAVVGREPLSLDPEALQVLLAHPWPGNVRELVNLARRVVLFAEHGRVDAALVRRMLEANPFAGPTRTHPTDAFGRGAFGLGGPGGAARPARLTTPAPPRVAPESAVPLAAPPAATAPPAGAEPEAITLEDLERRHIERLLAHHKNVTRVAEILDINRRTLQRKLRAWGIDAD